MSKFQTGDRVVLVNIYELPDVTDPSGVITGIYHKGNDPVGYSIKWDDGWVDDPEVHYYDSELKKAEEK